MLLLCTYIHLVMGLPFWLLLFSFTILNDFLFVIRLIRCRILCFFFFFSRQFNCGNKTYNVWFSSVFVASSKFKLIIHISWFLIKFNDFFFFHFQFRPFVHLIANEVHGLFSFWKVHECYGIQSKSIGNEFSWFGSSIGTCYTPVPLSHTMHKVKRRTSKWNTL